MWFWTAALQPKSMESRRFSLFFFLTFFLVIFHFVLKFYMAFSRSTTIFHYSLWYLKSVKQTAFAKLSCWMSRHLGDLIFMALVSESVIVIGCSHSSSVSWDKTLMTTISKQLFSRPPNQICYSSSSGSRGMEDDLNEKIKLKWEKEWKKIKLLMTQ